MTIIGAYPSNFRVRYVQWDSMWDDLRLSVSQLSRPGASDPAIRSWQPTGAGPTFYTYEFGAGDIISGAHQVPHGYKVASDFYVHGHWTPGARGAAESGNTVNWRVDISGASMEGTFPAGTTIDLTDTCDGTNEKHQRTTSVLHSGSGFGISSMFYVNVYRLAGDSWATNTPGNLPILLEVDIHYQINTPGSRQELVK